MGLFTKAGQSKIDKSAVTIIASGTAINGKIHIECKLHVDGEFSGIIQSTNVISIGKSGVVEGEVTAHKLMVTGQFRGNADCNEIEILAGGKVTGQISTSVLVIERGSTFDGESRLKGEITQIQQQPAYENIGYSPEA